MENVNYYYYFVESFGKDFIFRVINSFFFSPYSLPLGEPSQKYSWYLCVSLVGWGVRSLASNSVREKKFNEAVLVHVFISSTQETGAGRSLSSRPASSAE